MHMSCLRTYVVFFGKEKQFTKEPRYVVQAYAYKYKQSICMQIMVVVSQCSIHSYLHVEGLVHAFFLLNTVCLFVDTSSICSGAEHKNRPDVLSNVRRTGIR